MKSIQFSVVTVAVSLQLFDCGINRKLEITEVQPNAVELFLDEPHGNQLDLTNMKFKWVSQDPTAPQRASGEVDLGLAGTLPGGKFLMIFEDPNYMGAPIVHSFPGNTAGIRSKRRLRLSFLKTAE